MDLAQFDFKLPPECVAQYPIEPRDHSRCLVIRPNHPLEEKIFLEIEHEFCSGDVIVFNNTRVIPARILGKRDGVAVEVLLHRHIVKPNQDPDKVIWDVFAKPAKRLKLGQNITFADGFCATVLAKKETGEVVLEFPCSYSTFMENLERYGNVPLPPYIERDQAQSDKDRYQTVYAKRDGAVAAPTAGLHFTDIMIEKLRAKGVKIVYVTLHVGAGTFQPVKVSDVRQHVMHYEWCEMCEQVADAINEAKKQGHRVFAVGTTSVRVLETAADESGTARPYVGDTNIFITPGYRFKLVDGLITNFHLPKSTLFMLVSAFAGLKTMHEAYAYAIQAGFRFYSYGDASLIYRYDTAV